MPELEKYLGINKTEIIICQKLQDATKLTFKGKYRYLKEGFQEQKLSKLMN